MMTWNPETHPYRVTVYFRAPHLSGNWRAVTKTFETEAAARDYFDQPHPRCIDVYLAVAENAATWRKNGRFRDLASRKNRSRKSTEKETQ
jgi:hypothetical protein